MKTLKLSTLTVAIVCSVILSGCGKDAQPKKEDSSYVFAKGADISWVTQLESEGRTFATATGKPMECTALMKELGMNAIRLRVWVNTADGWNAEADVVEKAKRAHELGLRLMIDFHYSDTWADPGHQTIPAAWSGYDIGRMRQAVADHTTGVLSALKAEGIDVEWVQVGNETTYGMLWEIGKSWKEPANYSALTTAGYNALKSVYPDAKVIVHLDRGQQLDLYTYLFGDILNKHGGRYDIIGMSLYPDATNWRGYAESCIANIKDLYGRYGKPVMICEVGMPWDDADTSYQFLSYLIRNTRSRTDGHCLGVFYWEPECPPNFNGYTKGAFDEQGRPTRAMDAFK